MVKKRAYTSPKRCLDKALLGVRVPPLPPFTTVHAYDPTVQIQLKHEYTKSSARMTKLVDVADLNSAAIKWHTGSIPVSGTKLTSLIFLKEKEMRIRYVFQVDILLHQAAAH